MTSENPSAADTVLTSEWIDAVRVLVHLVWGEQACQRPEHWPEVRERLLERLAPLVDHAVAELARLFGGVRPVDDPAVAVWRTFPRLDRIHCVELARLLIQARAALLRRQQVEHQR